MLKHLTTLSGATVVAVVLIDAQLDLFFNATLVSVVSVGLAFWVALTCMIWLNFYVLESAVPNWLLSAVTYAIITSFFTLSIGVIVLVYNVMSLT
jgi:hypothetical protein